LHVIPLRGLTAAEIKCESASGLSLDFLACHSGSVLEFPNKSLIKNGVRLYVKGNQGE
jgi:hypothetical protein